MVISKFPLIRFSRFFCCFSNSSLNISFISVFNRTSEIVKSAILFVKLYLEVVYPLPYVQEVWSYRIANTELIRREVNEFNWKRAFLNTIVDEKMDIFNSTILNILNNFIPHEVVVCNEKYPPWFNKKIKALIQKKMLHLKIIVIIVVTLIWNVVWNIFKPAWMLLLKLLKKNIIIIL